MNTAISAEINPKNYYRLPWSLSDNGISWLEVTTSCNLACEGCYRPKVGGHKTLGEIADDLAVFKRERKSDCMSIAGGDPLVHPKIVEIVKMVKEGGWKPIINTNGLGLTPQLLKDLKQAGVFGWTFHVDTSQIRKDSKAELEKEHNALRQKFAEMIAAEGGMTCSFNQTVTSDTLDQIPDVVRWALKRPDIVHTVVFILYREPRLIDEFDYFARGKKITLANTYEKTEQKTWGGAKTLRAPDVVAKIREVIPSYEPSAYLNGTEEPNSTKWLIGSHVANTERSFGFVTPRFMELVQNGSHLIRGKWLSYSSLDFLSKGRSTAVLFGMIDPKMRPVLKSFVKHSLVRPANFFKKSYVQTFTIIQPIDMVADGRMSMCDGCPDMTVYKGKMYWSCRLEEIKEYGCWVTAAPKQVEQIQQPQQPSQVLN